MIDLGELLAKIKPFILGWFGEWIDYTPTLTGFSADPTNCVYRYSLIGKICTLVIRQGSNGTSNATTCTITLPIIAKTLANASWTAEHTFVNNGSQSATPGRAVIGSGGTVVNFYTDFNGGAWTNSGGKRVASCTIIYEVE